MAFNAIMQTATAHITKYLDENPTVIEFGNQRFRYDPDIIDACSVIAQRAIRKPVDNVWEFFEDLGYSDYAAIDLNDSLRALPMDLNYDLASKYGYSTQHDLVTNNGTGEHIFDQRLIFENMHNLCKVNGVMLCVLPFAPWINHGFYNYHPILWRDLAKANDYEWMFLWIAQNTGQYVNTDLEDWAFYEQKRMKTPMSTLEECYYVLNESQNISIVAAYKKTQDKPFCVPMQGRYVNDANEDIRADYNNPDTRQANHTYDHLKDDSK